MQEIEHGTKKAYSHKGCRCVECRAANARYSREWAARNPEATKLKRDRHRERRRLQGAS